MPPVFSLPSPLPLNDITLPSGAESFNHDLLPGSKITPQTRQAQNAAECMVSIASLVNQWNGEWGPVSDWPQQFTSAYFEAIEERHTVAFINETLQKIRNGHVLMEDITFVITGSTLPTSEGALRSFMHLVVQLINKLNCGVTILEDRLRLVQNLLDSAKQVSNSDTSTSGASSLTQVTSFL